MQRLRDLVGAAIGRPDRVSYLKGQVPDEIRDWWKNRNMWGLYRTEILGQQPYQRVDEVPQELGYKFIYNQGHLSPSYRELLRVGIRGLRRQVQTRRENESDADKLAFLTAAEQTLEGLNAWASRYAEFLQDEAKRSDQASRAAELREMARICAKIADQPPEPARTKLVVKPVQVFLAHLIHNDSDDEFGSFNRSLRVNKRSDTQDRDKNKESALHNKILKGQVNE